MPIPNLHFVVPLFHSPHFKITMDDEEPAFPIVKLRSRDDVVFEVNEGASKISELLCDTPRESDEVTEILIARVASGCLEKVVAFMQHYEEEPMKEIPTPLGGSSFNEVRYNLLISYGHSTSTVYRTNKRF